MSVGIIDGKQVATMRNDRVSAVLIEDKVHVLGSSSSSYGLTAPTGLRRQYICLDGCCDNGLQPDVATIVAVAKEIGAKVVVIRNGMRCYVPEICGLPVEDVSGHIGSPVNGIIIDRRC